MARPRDFLLVAVVAAMAGLAATNLRDDFGVEWEPQNAAFSGNGDGVALSLASPSSGCVIRTKDPFLYGSLSARIQLVRGGSAGTVTTFYISSLGHGHDEIDFEFLGNETGHPYTIQTNLYVGDVGNKEVQFLPRFDPTAEYHTYSVSWAPCMIVWYIDGTPIRVFGGVAFPTSQPMYAYASIWAAENWATQGGRVRTDWSKAPFVANYRDINLDVCKCHDGGRCAITNCPAEAHSAECRLSDTQIGQMRGLQRRYKIYDYCGDYGRFKGQMPVECKLLQH